MTARDAEHAAPRPGWCVAEHLRRFSIGIIVGVASMLPGISGGVLAVCFGIYERLIADLADIRQKLVKDLPFVIVVAAGMGVGMILIAFVLEALMVEYLILALFFFLGLIVGQLPELWKHTRPVKAPFTSHNILALGIGFVIMLSLIRIGTAEDVEFGTDIAIYAVLVFIGAIVAISKLAPGISGSTLILALGLYKPFMEAITSFNLAFLLPVFVGFVIGLFGFARIVDYAINNHRTSTYCMIVGLTLGSLAVVLNHAWAYVASSADVLIGTFSLLAGVIVSLLFVRFGRRNNQAC